MLRRLAVALVAGALVAATSAQAASAAEPTIVLAHGAWETAASWNLVAEQLRGRGYRVVAPELGLRTLARDAASVGDALNGIAGPVVLVGHSYGGAVITNAATGDPRVAALVFIAAFAPDRGESIFELDARVPGSLVPASLVPTPYVGPGAEVGVDLRINPLLYRSVFAADVAEAVAAEMAATQRPLTLAALTQGSGVPAWAAIPSWYLVARDDLAIPAATERFMAARAKSTTVEIASSHAAAVSHPDAVTDLIVAAARSAVPPPTPAIGNLRLSPSTFRKSTRVSFTLDRPAAVRFTVRRARGGRRIDAGCVAPTNGNRGRRGCTRLVAVRGDFTRPGGAGTSRFNFSVRFAGRALVPGRYRLVATPTADGRTGAPARTPFRIVR